jgi:L-amino acid N-acyltransferase YncA
MTNAKELLTRLATHEDAAAIAAIYNEGIAERIATFETEPRTAEQIVRQLLDKGDRFPTIVAERWSGRRVGRRRPLSNSPRARRAGFLEDRVPDLS